MKSEARFVFLFLWVFIVLMIYRVYFSIFEDNPSLFFIACYFPIVYFYYRHITTWLTLSLIGITLSSIIPHREIGEFIASQTYIWILICLLSTIFKIKKHEKNS